MYHYYYTATLRPAFVDHSRIAAQFPKDSISPPTHDSIEGPAARIPYDGIRRKEDASGRDMELISGIFGPQSIKLHRRSLHPEFVLGKTELNQAYLN